MKRSVRFTCAVMAVSSMIAALTTVGVAKASNNVTLTWLVRSDPQEVPWAKQVIKDFEKQNPNIIINLMVIPQSEIDQKLQTMIAGGDSPDVFMPNWSNSGYATYKPDLLNLTPYIKKDPSVIKDFSPKLLSFYRQGSQQLGLPILSVGSFLFYNKDLFNKAHIPYPTTSWDDKSWNWNKMLSDAKKLSKNTNIPSRAIYGVYDYMGNDPDAWLWGGDYFNKQAYVTGNMGTPQANNPGVRKSIQTDADLIFKYKVSPSAQAITGMNSLADPFLSGRIAMELTGGWGFWVFTPATFHWGVAAIPYTVPGRKITLYTDLVSIEKNTQHPNEAWKLVKFIENPNGALKTFMTSQGASPPQDQLLTQWYQMESKKVGLSVAQLNQLQTGAIKYGAESANHLISGYASIDSAISQSTNAVYSGQKSVSAAISDIQKALEALNAK